MAYAIHITKNEDWSDRPRNPVTQQEWEEINNSGLAKPINKWDSMVDNFIITRTDYDIQTVGPDPRLNIPDMEWISKLKPIAKLLGAKIQGDDGEVY